MPNLHLKGYQPDSFFYGFPKVSTVFRHSFRLLFWKNECERSHCRVSFALQSKAAIVPPGVIEKPTHPVDILSNIYFKNNLRNDYKNVWHVSVDIMETIWNFRLRCRHRSFLWISKHNATNGGILGIKIIFMEQKEHLLCNWESREWKHPKIKDKRLIWLFFWFSWPSYLILSVLSVLSCDR